MGPLQFVDRCPQMICSLAMLYHHVNPRSNSRCCPRFNRQSPDDSHRRIAAVLSIEGPFFPFWGWFFLPQTILVLGAFVFSQHVHGGFSFVGYEVLVPLFFVLPVLPVEWWPPLSGSDGCSPCCVAPISLNLLCRRDFFSRAARPMVPIRFSLVVVPPVIFRSRSPNPLLPQYFYSRTADLRPSSLPASCAAGSAFISLSVADPHRINHTC
mmetsp:Transcript_24730/g.42626  ORF Transcript_24730/g.42626 Transcript_24730/m.42626 type:complete len:211 (+) Transcript_24730:120-752(+)